MVENSFKNYIKDIEPVNDRIMVVKIGYGVQICIINVYVPNSEHTAEEKKAVYKKSHRNI